MTASFGPSVAERSLFPAFGGVVRHRMLDKFREARGVRGYKLWVALPMFVGVGDEPALDASGPDVLPPQSSPSS